MLGAAPMTVGERVGRFQEFTETLVRLRDGDHVTHAGRWFSTTEARTLPPLRRTPLLVAANGPRSLRFAARVGDGWITTGPQTDSVDEWFAGLASAAAIFGEAAAGRDRPDELRRYLLLDSAPHLSAGTGRVSLSSAAFFEDLVGRAAALGFTDVITHWPRPGTPYAATEAVLEQVAEMLPRLR